MNTPQGLARLEIPDASSSLEVSVPSPAMHSAAVCLPRLPPVEEEEPYTTGTSSIDQVPLLPFLAGAISPTYMDSQIPPNIRTHLVSPPFHSRSTSTSSAEFVVPGPSASPLLAQEFEHPRPQTSLSNYAGIFSPRSYRTLSARSSVASPRISSPPSATILSASQLHPPLQIHALRPKPRSASLSSATVVPNTPAATKPHHPLYYMNDEMAVFENRLKDAYIAVTAMTGRTDTTPIPLSEITRASFDSVLRFLHFSIYEPDTITLEEWITLLGASTQLQFPKVRRWAIREITSHFNELDAVTVIVLATKHDVSQWLAPAYAELCRRREPLEDSEAEELGATVAARVGRGREAVREEMVSNALCEGCHGKVAATLEEHEPEEESVTRIVQQTFWPSETF
ncbi:hypothetical protein EIP91_003353 [Steccherinum ochraceum]|uniref:BTB domain-containing protein n=1 Tax=Steccherinum ochraceum TaxID=92696 RepID=A0A4V2MW60_9APHY|nr:hypothetical protein EIP91_003353 [Steccherinum ochraceum]